MTEVETQERLERDASMRSPRNADIDAFLPRPAGRQAQAQRRAKSLAKKRFSPSLFVVHFGLEGTWPGIPHHMILFGPRYKGLLDDIYDHGVLPQDFSIYLHHPTVTDPSMAPAGHEHVLRAGPGRAHGQAAGRLGRDRARYWKSASSTRSGGG